MCFRKHVKFDKFTENIYRIFSILTDTFFKRVQLAAEVIAAVTK